MKDLFLEQKVMTAILNTLKDVMENESDSLLRQLKLPEVTLQNLKKMRSDNFKEWSVQIYQAIKPYLK